MIYAHVHKSNLAQSLLTVPSLKHFHTRLGKAFIEIHRYTDVYFSNRLDRVYQKVSDEGMSAGLVPLDFAGVQVMSPAVDFNVFFIFNHFWHHFIAVRLAISARRSRE